MKINHITLISIFHSIRIDQLILFLSFAAFVCFVFFFQEKEPIEMRY